VNVSYLSYGFDNDEWKGKDIVFNGHYEISVPSNATQLFYEIDSSDHSNNWQQLVTTKTVIDNDAPWIRDLTNGTPTRSSNFEFNASVMDNLRMKEVCLVYWNASDNRTVCKDWLSKDLTFDIQVPAKWTKIHYYFTALDNSGNLNRTAEKILETSALDTGIPKGPDSGKPKGPNQPPNNNGSNVIPPPNNGHASELIDYYPIIILLMFLFFFAIVLLWSSNRNGNLTKDGTIPASSYEAVDDLSEEKDGKMGKEEE
jgi:hypothetical protein